MTQNETVVRAWFEQVWNKRRATAIAELLSEHAIVHGLGDGDMHGVEGFRPFYDAFVNAFPDIHIDLEEVVEEGNLVAVRWTATGTHNGSGLGFPATGRNARFAGMSFLRLQDGLLLEGWNAFDQLALLQQLGVVELAAS